MMSQDTTKSRLQNTAKPVSPDTTKSMSRDTTKSMSQDTTKLMHRSRFWFVGLALLMSGCLLPQPDTPPIGVMAPGADMARSKPAAGGAQAAPASGEGLISNNAGGGLISNGAGEIVSGDAGLVAPEAAKGTAPVAAPGPDATLKGRITGMTVKTLIAVPETNDLAKQAVDVAADGTFTLSLPPGGYYLDVVVGDQALRVGNPVRVQAGETRQLTLTLQENPPKATLTEETTLAAPSPSPSPTPSTGPTASPLPMPQR